MAETLRIPTGSPDIVLAPITEQDDIDRFLAMRPDYTHPLPPNHMDAPDYWRLKEFRHKRAREDGLNPGILRTTIRARGHFVGVADLYPRAEEPKTYEVAYEVLENYQRNNYGLFAVAALTAHAGRKLGVEVVTFEVPNGDNQRIQIADTLGFRHTEEKSKSTIYVRKVTLPESTPDIPANQPVVAEATTQPVVLQS